MTVIEMLQQEACRRFSAAHRATVDFTLSSSADGSLFRGRATSDELDRLTVVTDRAEQRWFRTLRALGIPPPRSWR
jgi:hypothetical protein